MARRKVMSGRMTAFLVIVVVGLLMALLPPLVFGAGEGDTGAQPFWTPLIGLGVALLGLIGFVHAWWLHRRGEGEGALAADRDDSEV